MNRLENKSLGRVI